MREAEMLPTMLTSLVALVFTIKAHSLERTLAIRKGFAKTMIHVFLGKDS